MNLKKKAVQGFGWVFFQQFGIQGISFVVSIILARILLPEEFGIIGILSIFMSIGNTLIDGGLTISLIRTESPSHKDYSTVFFVNIFGAVFLYSIIFISAPYIAKYFNLPSLTSIIRIYTLAFIINAFVTIQITKLTKELNFKVQLLVQLPSLILSSIFGVFLALKGYGVWALVWMYLIQSFLNAVQYWLRSNWRPSFLFEREIFYSHFKFSYKILLSGIIESIYSNIYNIIIGKMYPAAQLGFYTRAHSLRQLPVQNLSTALHKITFPIFSLIQNEDERLKNAYKKIMQIVVFVITPFLISMAILAEPLFVFLFTDKWLPAVPYFQILCIPGILYPLHSYNLNILNVKGRSDLFLKLEIIKRAFITIGIIAVIPYGIYGFLYFQIASGIFGYIVNAWYSGKLINYKILYQVKDIGGILIISLLMGGVLWLFMEFLIPDSYSLGLQLFLGFSFYFGLYIMISILIKSPPLFEIKQLLKRK